jgi:hypothetical protein
MASSRGIEVDGRLLGRPRLLGSRQEQREVEFDLARARDLAHAYHLLDYYGAVYGEPEERDGFDGIGEQFSPVPLIQGWPRKRCSSAATPPYSHPTPLTCARASPPPADGLVEAQLRAAREGCSVTWLARTSDERTREAAARPAPPQEGKAAGDASRWWHGFAVRRVGESPAARGGRRKRRSSP